MIFGQTAFVIRSNYRCRIDRCSTLHYGMFTTSVLTDWGCTLEVDTCDVFDSLEKAVTELRRRNQENYDDVLRSAKGVFDETESLINSKYPAACSPVPCDGDSSTTS